MHIPVVTILKKKSYLAMIRNAAKGENNMFRNVYATVDGVEQDINKDGSLACGFFTSAILYINKLIADMHTGVAGLERDLAASGWEQVKELAEGAVIVWAEQEGSFVPGIGTLHTHAGFYVGDGQAISNGSSSTLMPKQHPAADGEGRTIARIWLHPSLK